MEAQLQHLNLKESESKQENEKLQKVFHSCSFTLPPPLPPSYCPSSLLHCSFDCCFFFRSGTASSGCWTVHKLTFKAVVNTSQNWRLRNATINDSAPCECKTSQVHTVFNCFYNVFDAMFFSGFMNCVLTGLQFFLKQGERGPITCTIDHCIPGKTAIFRS